jgi:hypothetical protein
MFYNLTVGRRQNLSTSLSVTPSMAAIHYTSSSKSSLNCKHKETRMARVGQISDAAQEVNKARDELAAALRAAIPDARYIEIENILAALEHFVNAKAR